MKNPIFRGRWLRKTDIKGGIAKKKGSWTICGFKRLLGEEERGMFLRGLITQCTLWINTILWFYS